jgi:hypothetical protein
MKVGDLVKVSACFEGKLHCVCWLCHHRSSRIGQVVGRSEMENMWDIIFDAGIWEAYEHEVDVISESR